MISVSPFLIVLVFFVVGVAGTVNGIAGFGFALIGTLVLATLIDPATAVVFMIVPILSVNVSLVRELSGSEVTACRRRFQPLLLAALVGTVLGMLLLDSLPDEPLRVILGLIAIGFVVSAQNIVQVPGLERTKDGCFVESRPAMIGVGGVSGVLFGATNVGVQLVAYLRSCDLSHSMFVGVVALVFLGLNGIRVVLAGALQLYPDLLIFALSIGAIAPAVVGVALGQRIRSVMSASWRSFLVLGLLTLVGVRLVLGGSGVA